MGNCNFRADGRDKDAVNAVNKNNFVFQYAIGRGGFGKVWRVESKKDKGGQYAMKEMMKARVIAKKSVFSVMNELKLLAQIKSDFIVNVHYAFQDRDNLFLIMDLLLGGDLRFHIARQRKFTQEQTKFFLACLIHALESVHSNNIIHRDIKPENLVFEANGYLRLTDFGIARYWSPDNSSETSGTPGYMAPEVMCRQNHGIAADYFAVGVIGYECMYGRRPYTGKSRREIRDQIIARQVQVKRHEIPDGWSIEAADFINKCIQRKTSSRLGLNGNAEVKAHPWFKDFDWQGLNSGTMQSPFIPDQNNDNFDSNHVNNLDWKDAEQVKESAVQLRRDSVQALFNGYYFDKHNIPTPSTHQQTNQTQQLSTIATGPNAIELQEEPTISKQKQFQEA